MTEAIRNGRPALGTEATMSAPRISILVIEDEDSIRRGLCDVLVYHGYEAVGVESGEAGLQEAGRGSHALVLLDVMLPGIDGFAVCEALRQQHPELPVLMLTARGSEEDVLRGFRSGSDDYVTKPFSIAELLARVEALLRRSGRLAPAGDPEPFAFGEWWIDPAGLTARPEGGADVELTRREVALLTLLAQQRGRIVSRRALLRDVWDMRGAERIETRTVDMHIAKLRKKLGERGRRLIETVRGEGYRHPA